MSADKNSTSVDELEGLMLLALGGDKAAAKKFFSLFLSQELFVPERYQVYRMSDSPAYPNDFVNILGIKDNDRALVPVFSKAEYIVAWNGNELRHRSLEGKALLKLMPTEWWLILNPGRETEKEFSPWEIEQLAAGEPGIDLVVSELFSEEMHEPIVFELLRDEEKKELRQKLTKYAASTKELDQLFLLREIAEDTEGKEIKSLVLGVELTKTSAARLETIKQEIKAIVDIQQIGDESIKLMVGSTADSIILGPFRKMLPFYKRRSSPAFLKKLFSKK